MSLIFLPRSLYTHQDRTPYQRNREGLTDNGDKSYIEYPIPTRRISVISESVCDRWFLSLKRGTS